MTRASKKALVRVPQGSPRGPGAYVAAGFIAFVTGGLIVALTMIGGPSGMWAHAGIAVDKAAVAVGFGVEAVEVVGAQEVAAWRVLNAAEVDEESSVFAQDLEEVRTRVSALDWVSDAAVMRVLPSTIVIRVEEREPVGLWQNNRQTWLIDQEGVPIAVVDPSDHPTLGLFVGAEANLAAQEFHALVGGSPALARRIVAAVYVGARRWDVKFDSGVTVALPESGAPQAWQRFAALEARHGLIDRGYARLDLRQPGLLVARAGEAMPTVVKPDAADRAT